jgi:hypothetical protein
VFVHHDIVWILDLVQRYHGLLTFLGLDLVLSLPLKLQAW